MTNFLCCIFALFMAMSSVQANPLLLKEVAGAGAKKVFKNKDHIKKLAAARKYIYSKVSTKSGVYSFKDENGRIYIGKAINLKKRLQQHLRSGKFPVDNGNSLTIKLVDKKNLLNIEKKLIRLNDFKSKGLIGNIQHAPMSNVNKDVKSALQKLKEKVGK